MSRHHGRRGHNDLDNPGLRHLSGRTENTHHSLWTNKPDPTRDFFIGGYEYHEEPRHGREHHGRHSSRDTASDHNSLWTEKRDHRYEIFSDFGYETKPSHHPKPHGTKKPKKPAKVKAPAASTKPEAQPPAAAKPTVPAASTVDAQVAPPVPAPAPSGTAQGAPAAMSAPAAASTLVAPPMPDKFSNQFVAPRETSYIPSFTGLISAFKSLFQTPTPPANDAKPAAGVQQKPENQPISFVVPPAF